MLKYFNFSKTIFLLISLLYVGNASAMPLVPDIYVSAGLNYSTSNLKYTDISTTSTTKASDMAYLLSLGIRPIDVPILGGLRVEGQYNARGSSSTIGNSYGLVLYYDVLRIIPFVNPYFGLGINNTTLNSSTDYKSDSNTGYSWHLGVNVELPVSGFGLFGEFRNISVKYNGDVQDSVVKAQNYDTLIGIRYYFLK